ncbi:glucosaminidase domain-containing protein [Jeotgalibacillus terrae]|uniref:Glucosaminidase domain-containing protein n=1 Tax=Jeotgalibacillus terrae TaxID=587735 RepID=A0ABW5ZHX9_9BACL|nr:glucosaminidase domain-containing protein [Jeotgalibacillus terrae]MBM7579351.1 putative ABC transport system permease protein [Jeotgalibacillus terrae]
MDGEELLKRDIVLSKEKIAGVQKYLLKKYPEASSKKRAALLSQTLHQMITRSLPDFEEEETVRVKLFEKMIQGGNMQLSRYDLAEAAVPYVSKVQLIEWLKLHSLEEQAADLFYADDSEVEIEEEMTVERKPLRVRSYLLSTALIAGVCILFFMLSPDSAEETESIPAAAQYTQVEPIYQGPVNELPEELKFTVIDQENLKSWLQQRDSMLAEEPYFSAIYQAAYDFNIHPYLLFAITGQEQGFVSVNHPEAEEIANNPFNVFHSWKDFNTSIEESSEIAARTVVNLSKGRPDGADPIQWINRKYAEDPNWWKGVNSIFEKMIKETKSNTNLPS